MASLTRRVIASLAINYYSAAAVLAAIVPGGVAAVAPGGVVAASWRWRGSGLAGGAALPVARPCRGAALPGAHQTRRGRDMIKKYHVTRPKKAQKKARPGTSPRRAYGVGRYANKLKSTSADGFLTAGLPSSVRY